MKEGFMQVFNNTAKLHTLKQSESAATIGELHGRVEKAQKQIQVYINTWCIIKGAFQIKR